MGYRDAGYRLVVSGIVLTGIWGFATLAPAGGTRIASTCAGAFLTCPPPKTATPESTSTPEPTSTVTPERTETLTPSRPKRLHPKRQRRSHRSRP